MKINEITKKVRSVILKQLREGSAQEMHRMISGEIVPFGCDQCIEDIADRIIDATASRNDCPKRTDSGEHYNGILKVLRRKLRRADKINSEELG